MFNRIRCVKCDKEISIYCEGFDGKALSIVLDITRYYSMCKECHNIKDFKNRGYFCSTQCLKEWIQNDLDKYVEDEVMWGKINAVPSSYSGSTQPS